MKLLGEFQIWFAQQPIITRTLAVLSLVLPFWIRFQPNYAARLLILDYSSLLHPKWNLWRLLTCFFVKVPSMGWLMSLVMRVKYSYYLENLIGSDDLSQAIMAIMALSLLINYATGWKYQQVSLWEALNLAIVYCWSRLCPPQQEVSLFGYITVPAYVLPFVLYAWDVVVTREWVEGLIGLVAGAVYWHLLRDRLKELGTRSMKRGSNIRTLTSPPAPVKREFKSLGGYENEAARQRFFTGQSYRLGD